MKPQLQNKNLLLALMMLTISICGYGQGKPETSKDIKKIVENHKIIALLPFTYAKKNIPLSQRVLLRR